MMNKIPTMKIYDDERILKKRVGMDEVMLREISQ